MYKIGDLFVYGSSGACRITDIKKENFGKNETTYYILSPVFDIKETIYIPIDNEALVAKMKRILTPEELITLIKTIPQKKSVWIENVNQRREEYKRIIKKANREELLALIKTLYERRVELQQAGKNLSVYDERFFRHAQNIIHSEISLVLQIPREEIPSYIEKTLSVA
ncbi:MAG: CarD family transcriptional regulator [Eubacterium sp.]|nr:CarD family transcriptional regulator [Eubacterium sp.]